VCSRPAITQSYYHPRHLAESRHSRPLSTDWPSSGGHLAFQSRARLWPKDWEFFVPKAAACTTDGRAARVAMAWQLMVQVLSARLVASRPAGSSEPAHVSEPAYCKAARFLCREELRIVVLDGYALQAFRAGKLLCARSFCELME